MRLLLILLSILLSVMPGIAQITGSVTDGPSERPLQNVNIFISGTSKGTVSAADGRFALSGIPPGKYELIISMVGYETIVHNFSTAQLPLRLKVELIPKVREQEAVTVVPFEKNGWERWGLLFTETFIGQSLNASRCKIRNNEVIRFRYYKKEKVLEAVADDILVIENKSLGYRIKYQLEGFTYNTATRAVVYLGYPLFEEMEKGRAAKYYKNRKKAYYGSTMHLMRCLYNNNLDAEGFEIWPVRTELNMEKQRVRALMKNSMTSDTGKIKDSQPLTISIGGNNIITGAGPLDSSAYYTKVLNQPDYFEILGNRLANADSVVRPSENPEYKILSFDGLLLVQFKKEPESDEYKRANPFRRPTGWQTTRLYFVNDAAQVQIEANGNYYNPIDLFTEGYMGFEKMGDMLPLDYEPPVEKGP